MGVDAEKHLFQSFAQRATGIERAPFCLGSNNKHRKKIIFHFLSFSFVLSFSFFLSTRKTVVSNLKSWKTGATINKKMIRNPDMRNISTWI